MELHPQLIKKEGKSEFVVLPFEEYEELTKIAHDYENLIDLRDLREAKKEAKGARGISIEKAISELGL